jgi:hypothetical protein
MHVMKVYRGHGDNTDDDDDDDVGPSVSKRYTTNKYTDRIPCFHVFY